MREGQDIAVVGGGIIGLAIAFRLVDAGFPVVLIDKSEPGRKASHGNAGHIATELIFPLASPSTVLKAPALMLRKDRPLSIRGRYLGRIAPWLMRFIWASRPAAFRHGTAALQSLLLPSLKSFATLCRDAGIRHLLHDHGHLILAESERTQRAAMSEQRQLERHGIGSVWLSPNEIRERVPDLTRAIRGALLVRGTGHVSDPSAVCDGLCDAFVAAGGRITQAEVESVTRKEDGTFELSWPDGQIECAKIVVAAGAWSRPLAKQLGFDVPLDTERGYNVEAPGWRTATDLAIASIDRMAITTPMDSGQRITGFVEFGGLELPPTEGRTDVLGRHLSELFPDAELPPLTEWMGFRPSLPDHLPVIGQSPSDDNVYFAFGHQHLGLTMAGITADAIANLCSRAASPVDLTPFRVDRF